MARFGLSSLVKRKSHGILREFPLTVVDEDEPPVAPSASSSSAYSTANSSIFDRPIEGENLSATSSLENNMDNTVDHVPHQPLNRKPSFESSVDTLVFDDSVSTVNTLLPGTGALGQAGSDSAQQRQYTGNYRALPIYSTRFKSGVQVFESDVAAKVSRTLARQRKHKNTGAKDITLSASDEIPMPPALSCQSQASYNPFTSKKTPFMTINRLGKTLRNPDMGDQPKTLLGDTVMQHQIELGLVHGERTTVMEESPASKPFCQVWQTVLSNDRIKYTLEFDNALDYAQSTVTLLNDGRNRATTTSYDGVHMRWDGTTGIGSLFGSGYFELRFCDPQATQVSPQHQDRRPPVAVYHNVGVKTLAATRKIGEFVIWEPGFEFADIIVTMGLVLREQEERKEIQAHRIAPNKLANF